MNIKKVDDKPMVIHTKEKAKLHIKQEPEAKIKGRNVLVLPGWYSYNTILGKPSESLV